MPVLFLVFFAAFACCVLGQFYLIRQVRRVLANRHPDVWRDLSNRAFFIDNAVFSFVWKGRDKALNDAELTQTVRRMRRLQLAAFAIWAACLVMMLTNFGWSGTGPR